MNRELLRRSVSLFLSFASSLLIALALASLAALLVLSKPVVTAVFSVTDYAQKAKAEILDDLEAYAIPGGLPADFFEHSLDDELLEKNISHAVQCAYSGEEFRVLDFGAKMKEQILAYAAENEIHSSTAVEMKSSIDRLVEYCESSYRTFTYSLILKYIGITSRALLRIVPAAAAAMIALAALLLSLVRRMNPEDKRFYFRSVLCGSALMLAALPVGILLSRRVVNLGISSDCLYALASGIIYCMLAVMILTAVILVLIATIKLPLRRK